MKILIVCHGNICRSPMAEGILRHKLTKANIKHIIVESAGFESFHVGDSPDNRAQSVMKKYNIDISEKRAQLFKVSDFDYFDHIYIMDENNYHFIKSFSRSENDMAKTDYIMNTVNPNLNYSVPDPYYGDKDGFELVYRLLETACDRIIETII